jgi:hypothetical protein
MMPPDPIGKKEPESPRSGKKAVMVFVFLFVVVIIGVIAVVVLVQSPAGSGATPSPAVMENPPGPAVPQPVRQPDTQPAHDSPVKPVDFVIEAGPQEKCGLTCRQLTPAITNTGDETAHNVCISLVMYNSGGDLIFLNGRPSIRQCIGNITSGESKSEPIVIEADCGFLASKCLRQTLILKTGVTCDETTVQFPDQMIAV